MANDGAGGTVFDDPPTGDQFVAQTVRFGPIPLRAGGVALGDQRLAGRIHLMATGQ